MADNAYAKLAVKLAEKDPAAIDPKLRDNILAFFQGPEPAVRHQGRPEGVAGDASPPSKNCAPHTRKPIERVAGLLLGRRLASSP